MNFAEWVDEAVCHYVQKHRARHRRMSVEVPISIGLLKVMNEMEGFAEPSEDELRDLWNVLKEHV